LDGTSNVAVYAERYGTCGNSGNPNGATTFGNLWSDSNSVWRAVFCIDNSSKDPTVGGYPPCPMFQVTPHWINQCNSVAPQSPHPAGINLGMADGSVRFARGGLSNRVWEAATDPRDGSTLASQLQ
jgi:prepilin-type processing-associated H-X9-DG protein